jgi:hypothetical protein
MGKTIFVGARKGGVGKTMTAASLGFGLAKQGKRVLLLDCDSQFSLTVSLGIREPDKLTTTLTSVLTDIIGERDFEPTAGILHHTEGVDFLPTSSGLTGIELALSQLIGREYILRQYIDKVKPLYDYVIIDTAPTLDLLTVNALAAADGALAKRNMSLKDLSAELGRSDSYLYFAFSAKSSAWIKAGVYPAVADYLQLSRGLLPDEVRRNVRLKCECEENAQLMRALYKKKKAAMGSAKAREKAGGSAMELEDGRRAGVRLRKRANAGHGRPEAKFSMPPLHMRRRPKREPKHPGAPLP